MKDYINQIYNEGLGIILYIPVKNSIDKYIVNELLNKIFTIALSIIYVIIVIVFAILLFLITYPL